MAENRTNPNPDPDRSRAQRSALTRCVGVRLTERDRAGLDELAGDFTPSAFLRALLRDRLRQERIR